MLWGLLPSEGGDREEVGGPLPASLLPPKVLGVGPWSKQPLP